VKLCSLHRKKKEVHESIKSCFWDEHVNIEVGWISTIETTLGAEALRFRIHSRTANSLSNPETGGIKKKLVLLQPQSRVHRYGYATITDTDMHRLKQHLYYLQRRFDLASRDYEQLAELLYLWESQIG